MTDTARNNISFQVKDKNNWTKYAQNRTCAISFVQATSAILLTRSGRLISQPVRTFRTDDGSSQADVTTANRTFVKRVCKKAGPIMKLNQAHRTMRRFINATMTVLQLAMSHHRMHIALP